MSSDHEATAKAEAIIRAIVVPLYPPEKPVHEMTPYEQGFFRLFVPAIAAALADAWSAGYKASDDDDAASAYVKGLERAKEICTPDEGYPRYCYHDDAI